MPSAHDLFCMHSPTQPGRGTGDSRILSQEPRGPTATGCPPTPIGAGPSPPPWAVLATAPLPATRGSAGIHSVDCHQETGMMTQLQMRKEHAPYFEKGTVHVIVHY